MAINHSATGQVFNGGGTTTGTLSATVNAGESLVVSFGLAASKTISGTPTWNGGNLTLLSSTVAGPGDQLSIWYALNPTPGTGNIAWTNSASCQNSCIFDTYAGNLTSITLGHNYLFGAVSPITENETIVNTGDWCYAALGLQRNTTAATNCIQRNNSFGTQHTTYDSNAGLTAGAFTMTQNEASAVVQVGITALLSVTPAATAGTPGSFLLTGFNFI